MTKSVGNALERTGSKAAEMSDSRDRKLLELRERCRSFGRRKVADIFALGGYLALAKSILSPREFGPWVRSACGFSPITALSYIAVDQRLAGYKDRLENVSVTQPVLFVIAYADDHSIERVVSALEAGQAVTASEARAITGVTSTRKATIDNALSPEEEERRRKAEEKLVAMLNRAFGGVIKLRVPTARGKRR